MDTQRHGSFEHPKHMFKLMGKEINTILGAQIILLYACFQKYIIELNLINFYILGNISGFFCCLLILSADFVSKLATVKICFRNTIRVSNRLDPDQARHFVGSDHDLTSPPFKHWKMLILYNRHQCEL